MEQYILGAIGTVGFPIVAFLLMYKLATKTIKENTDAIKVLSMQLKLMFNNGK
jgi:hypothetical protein